MSEAQIDKLNIEITANSEEAVKGIDKLSRSLNKLNKSVESDKTQKLSKILADISKLDFTQVNNLAKSGDGVNKFANAVNKLNKLSQNVNLTNLSTELQKIASINFGNIAKFSGLTQAISKAQQLVNQLNSATSKTQGSGGSSSNTNTNNSTPTAPNAATNVSKANITNQSGQSSNTPNNSGSGLSGITSSLFSNLKIGNTTIGGIQSKIESITSTITKSAGSTSTLGNMATKFAAGFSKAVPYIGVAVAGIALCKKWFDYTLKIGKGLLNVVKAIGSAIYSEIKNKISGIIEPVKNLISNIKRVVFNRLIREGFNLIQNGIAEGMKNVAQGVASANAVLSQYSTQMMYLKNSLGAMLIPLLQQLYPLFEAVTNVMIRATNAVNQFLSAIGGKNTYIKAKKQYVDYANSISSSSQKAKKSLSQLTAGFDELNDITETSTDTSDSDMSGYFTTVGIEANIDEFYERLKAGFSNGDLTGVGVGIANKLNAEISKVDSLIAGKWTEKANTWARSLGTLLNGSLLTLDFENIGKTVADGLNLIVSSINTFKDSIDFENLGAQIGNGLYGMVMSIDWDGIGTLFINMLVEPFETLKGFTDKMLAPVEEGGKARVVLMAENIMTELTKALQANVGKIEEIGDTVGNFILAVFEFGATIFGNSDFWNTLGNAISVLCSKLAAEFENSKFVKSVKEFIEGLADVACTLIEALNESGLIDAVCNVATEVFSDPKVLAAITKVFRNLGDLAGKVLKAKIVAWCNGILAAITGVAISAAKSLGNWINPVKTVKGGSTTVAEHANGGFPEVGQMFIAREAGPELVGTMGTKTAVANNGQIIEGITQGAYEGVARAMVEASSSQSSSSQAVFYLDGKKFAEATVDNTVSAINRKGLKLRTV